MFFKRWVKPFDVKSYKFMNFSIYYLLFALNQSLTFCVFFHCLKRSLIANLILSSITLLILPSWFFAGYVNLTCALFAKLAFLVFNVMKQLLSPLISTRFRISFFFQNLLTDHICIPVDRAAWFLVSWCECISKKYLMLFFA